MIKEALFAINSKCPLTILEISWDEYNLNIIGNSWNFNTVSSWRLINHSGLWGYIDSEAIKFLNDLRNETILEVRELNNNGIDLEMVFSNETVLQVFSTTYFEPWIFRIEHEQTFVASFPLFDDRAST